MHLQKKIFRNTLVLTSGQVASYGLSFARNIILARILVKSDFALAALFGMTISLLEVAGRMSFGQQIIQSKDGDLELFQATSHVFQFVLSLVGAFLIVILSHPVANAFHVPQDAFAFGLLAVVPLARGFEHLDYCRQQRELKYIPAVLYDLIPQIIVTIATWPLAVWLGDFRVILWVMIARAILGLSMTHLLAKRSYRWIWTKGYVKGMWRFGWPLLLNGLLIFGSQQADQMLVGAYLSLNLLAGYALALSLVSTPWFIVAQVGSSIMLPILSRVQDDPIQFRRQYRLCVEFMSVGAVALTLPMIIAGEQIVVLLYGSKYAGTGTLMAILGTASAVRFFRFTPAIASMARADTLNQLYSNLCRCLSLPMAITVVFLKGGVTTIATCALLAEILAAVISVIRLHKRQGVSLRDQFGAVVYFICFMGAGLGLSFLGTHRLGYWLVSIGISAILVMAMLIARIAFPVAAQMLVAATARKESH